MEGLMHYSLQFAQLDCLRFNNAPRAGSIHVIITFPEGRTRLYRFRASLDVHYVDIHS
jgi:hypothetical protein